MKLVSQSMPAFSPTEVLHDAIIGTSRVLQLQSTRKSWRTRLTICELLKRTLRSSNRNPHCLERLLRICTLLSLIELKLELDIDESNSKSAR